MLSGMDVRGYYNGVVSSYPWIRAWVFILSSVAPLSLTYGALRLILPSSLRLPRIIEYWALAEALFYLFTYVYRYYYLERPTSYPQALSPDERQELFRMCQKSCKNPERYISKWFLDAPIETIKRENVKEFFRWAFFNTAFHDHANDEEVEELVKTLELQSGLHFEPGRGDVICIRLTIDGVRALHRSLLWYGAIFFVDMNTHAYLFYHGFLYYRASIWSCMAVFPPRPQTVATPHQSPVDGLGYWSIPHTSRKELPIVFLHGIGVGLYPYMEFLAEINQGRSKEEGEIGIIAIELLPISSRLATPFPPKEKLCKAVQDILEFHGISKFILMSHSYGSVVATHMLKTPDIAPQISSVIFVDPITIMLQEPDVAYNFTVRRPVSAQEWLLYYFGSKDISTAHTLARRFFWYENVLWKEDLAGHHVAVFLSGNDAVTNAELIRAYLEDKDEELDGTKVKTDIEVVWTAGLNHGQIFDAPRGKERLLKETLKQAREGRNKSR